LAIARYSAIWAGSRPGGYCASSTSAGSTSNV
jgi:hypothetical protein